MKRLALSILALTLLTPGLALAEMDTSLDRPVSRQEAAKPADKAKPQPKDERPASAKSEGVATATCVDGKTYFHPTGEHRGACAKHGGVASWADGRPVKHRKASGASYR